MIAPTLSALENDLRRAAGQRAYADVERLVVSLCSTAAAEVRALPPDDAHEIAVWVDDLLDWTDTMLRSARAAQADELRRIPFVRSYLTSGMF